MAFKKISSPTLKELFINEMESMILSGELAIGERLPPEREIAQKMQISRSVVNDGIVEMARKGFLTIVPRQGTYVADYKTFGTIDTLVAIMKNGNVNNDYIRSVLELRMIFMDYALESAIKNLDEDGLNHLKEICFSFQNTVEPSQAAQIIYEFDHYLMTFSDNTILPLLFSSFRIPNTMLFERYFIRHGIKKMHQRNMMLLHYIERKDIVRAKETMQQSIQSVLHGKTEIYTDETKHLLL